MNKNNVRGFVAIAGFSALGSPSYALQPPCTTSSGNFDTACGTYALADNTGNQNTAVGYAALAENTSGSYNTSFGAGTLTFNHTANGNAAFGYAAMQNNRTGSANTAAGAGALKSNSQGFQNTAIGNTALNSNSRGNNNVAVGFEALFSNNSSNNIAVGYDALYSNTTGVNNTAIGYAALFANESGDGNTTLGNYALTQNATGIRNVAFGNQALGALTTGDYNTGLGFQAGDKLTTGSYNVDIANPGHSGDGVTANSGVIRIGDSANQASTFIAGIYTAGVTGGLPVYVNVNGQLGFSASSERYKTDIASLGAGSGKLAQLRPVSFHVKSEPDGAVQYGLIAEEVAKVYPELVIRDSKGVIQGVRYDELAPMLLNEVQQQAAKIASLEKQLAGIQAALAKLPSGEAMVAQR